MRIRLFVKNAAMILSAVALFTACEKEKNPEKETLPLQLLSVRPMPGEELSPGAVEATFEFNQPVDIIDAQKITLNGKPVDKAYSVLQYVKTDVHVEGSSTYMLAIGAGAVAAHASGETNAAAFTTEFSVSGTTARSAEAEKLLKYLRDNVGVKMLSGVSACINWNQNEAEWVRKHTGKYPAINGFDYIHHVYSTPGGWIDYSNITPAKSWADNNGVVAAMWHWGMRTNDGSTFTCTPGSAPGETGFHPSSIFDPDSEGYKQMIHDIDQIAGWMKPLAELRIPILWRPLHEAQGNWNEAFGGTSWYKAWFWWGIDGPEACAELWRVMYKRMVEYHGLNNLIWVYNTGDSMQWYPGDEYVDIVAYDFYNQSMDNMKKLYNMMKTMFPHKLLAVSEFGNMPKISEQWKAGLHWSYFMPWWDNARTDNMNSEAFNSRAHNNADIDWWEDALNCDFIVTRDQLPSFR